MDPQVYRNRMNSKEAADIVKTLHSVSLSAQICKEVFTAKLENISYSDLTSLLSETRTEFGDDHWITEMVREKAISLNPRTHALKPKPGEKNDKPGGKL